MSYRQLFKTDCVVLQ